MTTTTKTFTVTITGPESDIESVYAHDIENSLNDSLAFCMVDSPFDVSENT